jgi:hypothetical protein
MTNIPFNSQIPTNKPLKQQKISFTGSQNNLTNPSKGDIRQFQQLRASQGGKLADLTPVQKNGLERVSGKSRNKSNVVLTNNTYAGQQTTHGEITPMGPGSKTVID